MWRGSTPSRSVAARELILSTLQHCGADPTQPAWTRAYAYVEPSQLEPGKTSNRLSHTTVGRAAPTVA